ncbi:MAG: alpha/beta hydrolase [Chloroflexi bacterium]|nr:alpha/beta hydrolase [Chloroflexota bacterium]MCY3582755.1 alpha/beta hydrolase [Chloroflexota bacterium]MCY3715486.1 alpha/beta hydrolase [Chloroflexota bacterium]MDE2650282.1 alpha/beta hydrolase [Chloroflexota bacterium]
MQVSRRVIDSIEIRQAVIGEGAPLLMAHGWGASIETLFPLADRLSRQGYRCAMADLPGFGESAEPPQAWAVRDYVEFCLAFLDSLGWARAHYFGHSLGGRIGLMLTADYPQRVHKMTLSNSAGIKVEPSIGQRIRLAAYRRARGGLTKIGANASAESLRRLYNQRFGSADYLQASPIMRGTLVTIVNQDLLAYARRAAAPTVLIWGDADEETPLWMGQKLEATMPDAALIVHPGAGHYAYLDFPERTASIMDALFRSE